MTVVTRESPWDDETRDRVLSHAERKRLTCRCGCGQLATESVGSEDPWFVDFYVCEAGRALELKQAEHRKDAEDDDGKLPEGWGAGRHYFVKKYDPDTDVLKGGPTRGNRNTGTKPPPRKRRL